MASPAALLRLQRLAGNAAVTGSLAGGAPHGVLTIQRDPTVGDMCGAPAPAPNATPVPAAPENVCREPVRVVTYQGTQYAIPQSQWPAFTAKLKGIFRGQVIQPIESRMSMARGLYDSMKALNDDQYVVAWVLEAVRTGINLDEVLPFVVAGEKAVANLRKAAAGDDLPATETAARTAQEKADAAYRAITEYRARQISSGEYTVTALEVTQTICFTVFAVAGGAVLAAPVAAGGLGLGVVSSGAIMGGGTALLSSASGVGAKVVYGDEAGWGDIKNVAIDTVVGAAGGAAGSAVAAKLAPHIAPALTRSLIANGLVKDVSEEALLHAVRGVVAGSSGGVVQGAITDGVRVLEGRATFEQLLRNVVVNLIAGGIAGLVSARLTRPGGPPAETSTPQTRNVRVSNPEALAEYQATANRKLPEIVRRALANERSTPNRARLARLRTEFDTLRTEVGDTPQLTPDQRTRAMRILTEARRLGKEEYKGLRTKIMRDLGRDPELEAIANRMIAAGDAQPGGDAAALRVKLVRPDGSEQFEPMNLDHLTRQSDNPWMTKTPTNLVLTDAPQNQQYLEAIRQKGSVWPTDEVEAFVVRHRLNKQGIDFSPQTR